MTTEKSIKAQLDHLADLQSKRDLLALDKAALMDSILTPAQKAQLAEIDAEFADQFAAVDINIQTAQDEVRASVQTLGQTVKGKRLQAVYVAGRIAWNTAAIDGYAIDHPELFAFRNEGKPSVTLRTVKG